MMATLRLMILRTAGYFIYEFGQYRNAHVSLCACRRSMIEETSINNTKPKHRTKTIPIPKITLILLDGSIKVTELENAQRLAKHRKLTLVKVNDPGGKMERSKYKLVDNTILFEEKEDIQNDDTSKQKSKGIKILYISTKIAENDLLTKVKNAVKLLKKDHKVKIVISQNDDTTGHDKTQSIIENAVKNYGSIQKQPSKKNVVLLLISPLSNQKESHSIDNKEDDVTNN